MKKKIWTILFSPFTMGGNVNQPISTEVEVLEIKTIRSFKFFSFITPKGSIRICDGVTGGIIAQSWEELKANMKGATSKVLNEQIAQAREVAKDCREVSNEEFFKSYKY